MNEIPFSEIKLPQFLANSPLTTPPPLDAWQQVQRYAYDIAWGALNRFWNPRQLENRLNLNGKFENIYSEYGTQVKQQSLEAYVFHVWFRYNLEPPTLPLLESFGYVERHPSSYGFNIMPLCYALLNKPRPHSIFISYRRKTSSTIAMLIWSELRAAGYEVFLDVSSIELGDTWHALLEKKVKESTVFIPVITNETELSDPVLSEITWAISDSNNRRVIPILHNGFTAEQLRVSKEPLNRLYDLNLIQLSNDLASELYGMIKETCRIGQKYTLRSQMEARKLKIRRKLLSTDS